MNDNLDQENVGISIKKIKKLHTETLKIKLKLMITIEFMTWNEI